MSDRDKRFRFIWEKALMGEGGPHGKRSAITVAVGLALATFADKQYIAFPSIVTLSRATRHSERAVWAALKALAATGWISKKQVKSEANGKGWRRNEYTLALPAGYAPGAIPSGNGHASSATPTSHGLANGAPSSRTDPHLVTHPVPTKNLVLNTAKQNNRSTAPAAPVSSSPRFKRGKSSKAALSDMDYGEGGPI